ncbi:23S rRNA (guanosine(2251)-2'-O)-methyltransferase RlmB [Brevundimonas sp. S30B]|uniref:23S rRNA (guanosine(2251)-2'-O)-methyltransferase RlmB n=1 Tax=unclassified Brevundimonas TaxID=2622653 RepID=UPI0010717850|nr:MULTISPECIES: 23S rRNA (guanosine(2251)-2'-O)-methyltransferase RlmB [unclassified Brevundimonas]QBX36621.1 23S rRNA (guanosine(2251)-2'-O)-methyltransferase RlmB [Brevundimonas sp. MF30-B]TFW00920.1 23S rRNA (guanosine(2251)-2'-O)-methyltransferase RlmB [Brevundimonas sp. S30B]
MSSNRERNDRKTGKKQGFQKRPEGRPDRPGQGSRAAEAAPRAGRTKPEGDNFLWGRHPVLAALANPARRGMGRLMATEERAAEIERDGLAHGHRIEVVDVQALTRLLPAGAVHQGLAFKVQPLEGVDLRDLAEPAEGLIVMLDQLTDPQNVGAIFRSALAFGARGIVVQDRHAPALAGALAKAAVGATERLPHARVTNLSRALETLAEHGWRAVGLDGDAEHTLEQALDHRPTVLVMGSEGDGVRRLVAEHCEVMARIPMPGGFESLNVSNAAAVALYEAARAQGRKPAG